MNCRCYHCNRPDEIALELRKYFANENQDNEKNGGDHFNNAVTQVVDIIVSYDMGWSRRGNCRSYDNLNGYGAVIGFLRGKILDYQTRDRKCKLCDTYYHDSKNHDC